MVHARRTASRWGAFAAAGIALLLLAGAPDRAEPAPSQKAEAANQAHGADYAPSKTNAATFAPKPSDAAEHHSGGAPNRPANIRSPTRYE